MRTEIEKIRDRYICLTKRHEKLLRLQGNYVYAYACAEIRRAICAVKLPKEPMSGGKEAGDGQGK